MAKGKADKKGKKHKQKEVTQSDVILAPFDNKFDIDGVVKLVLSTISQRAVGCVVGEDITTDDPWIYVKKEKIEDNLELHEESSEFLPIKQFILEYPDEEMLIGFDKPIEDDKLEFFICTKITAKNEVADILEKQKEEMQERLKQSVVKRPGTWNSFGSETEVDENIIRSLRPLIEVELDSKYPLYSEKKKFRLRLVEHAVDGYVEILPGRFPITNVYRKLIDCGTQVAPPTTENEAQTNPTYPKNVWTQYQYEYDEPKLDVEKSKHLVNFMVQQAEELDDTIHVNEHINLYTNDYLKIAKQVYTSAIVVNRDVIAFRDVLSCKNKMVSDVTLDPFTSGILAASYSRWPFNKFYSLPLEEDEVNETTFGTHLVLLWCNSDSLKPKLYLHSFREINRIRYCAQRPNILLGGCSNGQVVIWDLNGKLETIETKEILTPTEQKHRIIMHSLMGWMKNMGKINVLLPTVITNLDYSHNAPVTGLFWILNNCQMTKNGKIEKLAEGEEDSLQFITCGMDGKILVWDLLNQPLETSAAKKKTSRLGKRPSALLTDVSEFRGLNNNLMPIFRINIRNKITQLPYPITCMVIKNSNFLYKARNPETCDSMYERTYFDFVGIKDPNYEFQQTFELTDKLGNFFHCTFEGHDFDQGQKVNYEGGKLSEYNAIHDGPIRVCITNYLDEDVILTVGGRVFAIWDIQQSGRPIFWRKSPIRYVSGIWSSQQVGTLVISRADSYFETWTLLQRTDGPGRLIRMTGNTVNDQFSDDRRKHVKKNTFAVTDTVGAVRIYLIPRARFSASEEVQAAMALTVRKRALHRREKYKQWVEAWKQRYGPKTEEAADHHPPQAEQEPHDKPPADEEEAGAENKEETNEEPKEEQKAEAKVEAIEEREGKKKKKEPEYAVNKWKEKQEKIMYDILLEKKKLNLAEIEQHKIPLQKLIEQQQSKQVKVQEILEKREEIFLAAKKKVFKASTIKQRIKIQVSFPPEVRDAMKETYLEHFDDLVPDTIEYINSHHYRHSFGWSHMITQGKERRRSISAQYISPVNRDRQQKKLPTITFADEPDVDYEPSVDNEEGSDQL